MFTRSSQTRPPAGGDPWSDHGLSVTGVNFRTSSLDRRAQLALTEQRLEIFSRQVEAHPKLQGAVVLSTCNRTEVIAAAPSVEADGFARETVVALWQEAIEDRFWKGQEVYHLENRNAVRHVFRVASGLDSMIVGEPQVLGQLKSAFARSCRIGNTDTLLHRLFQHAFTVAKRVRAETAIARYPVSVAYAARVLCEHLFGDISATRILLLGAGDTGCLMLKHLQAAGARRIVVSSRTDENAREAAAQVGASVLPWSERAQALAEADIVIGACSLPAQASTVFSSEEVADAEVKSRGGMQLYIDLGVPRNFPESINQLADVFLYSIDDLQSVVQDGARQRSEAAKEAEELVRSEMAAFENWLCARPLDCVVRDVRQQIQAYERFEQTKTLRRLQRAGFSPEQCALLQDILVDYSDALIAKVLHKPLRALRNGGDDSLSAFSAYFLEKAKEAGGEEWDGEVDEEQPEALSAKRLVGQ